MHFHATAYVHVFASLRFFLYSLRIQISIAKGDFSVDPSFWELQKMSLCSVTLDIGDLQRIIYWEGIIVVMCSRFIEHEDHPGVRYSYSNSLTRSASSSA